MVERVSTPTRVWHNTEGSLVRHAGGPAGHRDFWATLAWTRSSVKRTKLDFDGLVTSAVTVVRAHRWFEGRPAEQLDQRWAIAFHGARRHGRRRADVYCDRDRALKAVGLEE